MKTPVQPLLVDYCLAAASQVFRPARGCLSHPYLVPGGSYAEQLWDWDSWWLARGLLAASDHAPPSFRGELLRHAVGSWRNFCDNQASNDAIPLLIETGRGDPFGSAREDGARNQAKPVLAQFAVSLAEALGDYQWIEPYFGGLMRFLDRWGTLYGTPSGLIVWGSDVAVGTDNDPAIYGRPEFSSAGLLLNCFYAADLAAAAKIARKLDRPLEAQSLNRRADAAAMAIRAECWDPIDGFFYNVDVQCRDRRDDYIPKEFPRGMNMTWQTLPLKLKGSSGFAPLWAGIATAEQARIVVDQHWRPNDTLNARWGVRTLASNERMYAPEVESSNPSNWLGPVWIVSSFMTWEGLRRYGYVQEASLLADKTLALLEQDLERTGTLHECYHPDTGSPNFNAGFLSWNTLALLMTPATPGAAVS